MILYFLRHGIAEAHSLSDSARELTSEGIMLLRKQVPGIKQLDLQLDLILSSPYVRAKQTAEIIAGGLGYKDEILLSNNITPSSKTSELVEEICAKYASYESILLACHEPFISGSIAYLTSQNEPVIERGSLSKVCFKRNLNQGAGQLEWLYGPSQQVQITS